MENTLRKMMLLNVPKKKKRKIREIHSFNYRLLEDVQVEKNKNKNKKTIKYNITKMILI